MAAIIRTYDRADAEADAEVVRGTVPYQVTTARAVDTQPTGSPAAQRRRPLAAADGDRTPARAGTGLLTGTGAPEHAAVPAASRRLDHQPFGHQPVGHQPFGHQPCGYEWRYLRDLADRS